MILNGESFKNQNPQTKIDKANFETTTTEFVARIKSELVGFGIDLAKFQSNVDHLATKLLRFLAKYEIDPKKFGGPDLVIMGMCLMDCWENAGKNKDVVTHTELRKIINQFKYICIVTTSVSLAKNDQGARNIKIDYEQLSPKILEDFKKGSKLAEIFIPDNQKNAVLGIDESKEDAEFSDAEPIDEFNKDFAKNFPKVAKLLARHGYPVPGEKAYQKSQKNDKPFIRYIIVDNDALGGSLARSATLGKFTGHILITHQLLALNRDDFENILLHETNHFIAQHNKKLESLVITQGGHKQHPHFGLATGYLDYRGVMGDEAATENFIADSGGTPIIYQRARNTMDRMVQTYPHLKSKIRKVYYGSDLNDFTNLEVAVFNISGAPGVIALEFSEATRGDKSLKDLGQAIYHPTQEAFDFFTDRLKMPFYKYLDYLSKRFFNKYDMWDPQSFANKERNLNGNTFTNHTAMQNIIRAAGNLPYDLANISKMIHLVGLENIFVDEQEFKHFLKLLKDLDYFVYDSVTSATELEVIAEEVDKIYSIIAARYDDYTENLPPVQKAKFIATNILKKMPLPSVSVPTLANQYKVALEKLVKKKSDKV